MSKTVKRALWQRTLDRTVLRQPLPRVDQLRHGGGFSSHADAFLAALEKFCEEINAAPRRSAMDGLVHYLTSVGGEHKGGWRLIGEAGPEMAVTGPRRVGTPALQGTLALEARLAQWQRNLDSDGEGDSCD